MHYDLGRQKRKELGSFNQPICLPIVPLRVKKDVTGIYATVISCSVFAFVLLAFVSYKVRRFYKSTNVLIPDELVSLKEFLYNLMFFIACDPAIVWCLLQMILFQIGLGPTHIDSGHLGY